MHSAVQSSSANLSPFGRASIPVKHHVSISFSDSDSEHGVHAGFSSCRSHASSTTPIAMRTDAPPPAYVPSHPASATSPASSMRSIEGPTTIPRRRHDPYATALPLSLTSLSRCCIAPGISHQPLVGRCRFVTWPAVLRACMPPAIIPAGAVTVHVEQVKFELTAPQLRFLIHRLAGVVPIAVTVPAVGTFAVHLCTRDDADAVKALHRGLLFDQHGVWAPESPAEKEAVVKYMTTREFRQRGQRLPRDVMLITVPASSSSSPLNRRNAEQPN
jgi:hypothetical protein